MGTRMELLKKVEVTERIINQAGEAFDRSYSCLDSASLELKADLFARCKANTWSRLFNCHGFTDDQIYYNILGLSYQDLAKFVRREDAIKYCKLVEDTKRVAEFYRSLLKMKGCRVSFSQKDLCLMVDLTGYDY